MKLVLASNNKHKIAEIRDIMKKNVSAEIEVLSLAEIGFHKEIVENGTSFEENALIKARAAASMGYIAMADDSGLAVDHLDGAPGIYSARFAGEPCDHAKNNEKLLSLLDGIPTEKRSAHFVSVVALVIPRKGEFTVRGECPGRIIEEYKGQNGFGYDPLFLYEPFNKTFAELSSEEKNSVSHRARSMTLFCTLLKEKIKEYDLNYADK